MRLLPDEHRFPCDAKHLVIVRNVKDFANSFPEVQGQEISKALNQPWVWAFVSRRQFPIYVLQVGEQRRIAENYALGQTPWLRFFMACVLVHEHAHISQQDGDAAAYRAELNCINEFKSKGEIPQKFPTAELEQAIQHAESSQLHVAESSHEQEQSTPSIVMH